MRILIANDGFGDGGGVQTYLEAVLPALQMRGHDVRILHCAAPSAASSNDLIRFPHISTADAGIEEAMAEVGRWRPDLVYSHNMAQLEVEERLVTLAPAVKFMHGYFGTCLSGLKMHAFPTCTPCGRTYGPACTALFLPRRCGLASLGALVRQRRWTERQRALFARYAAVVVASRHMRDEYVRNGVASSRACVNPLFASNRPNAPQPPPADPNVAFMGRMTRPKGGDLLVRAVAHANRRRDLAVRLTMIGDGPQRDEWARLAGELGVSCTFTRWMSGNARWALLARASVVAIPSAWPEPFGLVGLEAGALGVPAIATGVGGIEQWLEHGVNGVVVPPPASPEAFGDALAAMLADRAGLMALRSGAFRVAAQMTIDAHVDRLQATFCAALGLDAGSRLPAVAG